MTYAATLPPDVPEVCAAATSVPVAGVVADADGVAVGRGDGDRLVGGLRLRADLLDGAAAVARRVAGDAADESLLGAHVTGRGQHGRARGVRGDDGAQGLGLGRGRAVGGIRRAAEVDDETDALLAGLGRGRAADCVEGEDGARVAGGRLVGDGEAPAVDGAVLGDRLVRALLRVGPGAAGELVEAPVAVGGGVSRREGQGGQAGRDDGGEHDPDGCAPDARLGERRTWDMVSSSRWDTMSGRWLEPARRGDSGPHSTTD